MYNSRLLMFVFPNAMELTQKIISSYCFVVIEREVAHTHIFSIFSILALYKKFIKSPSMSGVLHYH